jgi:hypothetical protein
LCSGKVFGQFLELKADGFDYLCIALCYLISSFVVMPQWILIGADELLLHTSRCVTKEESGFFKAGLPGGNAISNLLNPLSKFLQLTMYRGGHSMKSLMYVTFNPLVAKKISPPAQAISIPNQR